MPVAALFASHTPLKDFRAPAAEIVREVDATLATVRAWVADYDPELVIALGPDHFNGFFYRLMPGFCIGTAASSVGDWRTPPGALPVSAARAEACVRALHRAGVDVALSHRMDVDHGITQLLMQMFEWSRLPPLIPVFINCAAPPLPPLARVQALGHALGTFAREANCRVLLTASGGLSHDPPIPSLVDAPPPVRERLIDGGVLSAQARAARQDKVLNDAGDQVAGVSPRRPLNPAWDQAFLDFVRAGDFASICALDDDAITTAAGCGGHELRTWLAVAVAARTAGLKNFEQRYYRAIPQWVAGYAIMTAIA